MRAGSRAAGRAHHPTRGAGGGAGEASPGPSCPQLRRFGAGLQEGASPTSLPGFLQPSTASLAKPGGLQTGPVLPGFPRPQSLGQKNGSLGQAPPHPDCDPSLRQLSPKVTSSPTFKWGVLPPPSSGSKSWQTLAPRTWESPALSGPHFLVRESGEMWRTPSTALPPTPLGAASTLLKAMTQKSPPEDHLHQVGTSPHEQARRPWPWEDPHPACRPPGSLPTRSLPGWSWAPQSQDTETQLQGLNTPRTLDGGLLPWILQSPCLSCWALASRRAPIATRSSLGGVCPVGGSPATVRWGVLPGQLRRTQEQQPLLHSALQSPDTHQGPSVSRPCWGHTGDTWESDLVPTWGPRRHTKYYLHGSVGSRSAGLQGPQWLSHT